MTLPNVFPYPEAPRYDSTPAFRNLCHPVGYLSVAASTLFGRGAMSHDDEIVRAQIAQAVANMEQVLARTLEGGRTSDILTLLYDRKINTSVASIYDEGWTARLGDHMNGFVAEAENFASPESAARWLLEEATRRHPDRMAREL